MSKPICSDCGGTIHGDRCLLCELFNQGMEMHVEACRLNKPKASTSVGCHPRRRQEFEAHSRRNGVPTEFNSEGQAIFRSRAHQKEYLKVRGLVNHDGGYGD